MQEKKKEILNFTIYKTNLFLRSKLQAALKEFDITTEQWIVLKCIYENSGINQKELSELLFKEQAVITRILDLLEKRDLIERKKTIKDKRKYLIYLTDTGKTYFEKTLPFIEDYKKWLANQLSDEDTLMLTNLLNKLNENIMEDIGS